MLNIQLKKGETRWCLLVGGLAFKFPNPRSWGRFINGLLNNIFEISQQHQPGVAPILWSAPGGFLIVMPRCENPEGLVAFLGYPHWVECKPSSFGVYQGKVVAVDWGKY